ncbi:MAG TPA: hypothetical protein VFE84_00875 [Patescibacteria group bacterium]|nr:hypothetical protein [Patescibacteria group bacterium]
MSFGLSLGERKENQLRQINATVSGSLYSPQQVPEFLQAIDEAKLALDEMRVRAEQIAAETEVLA